MNKLVFLVSLFLVALAVLDNHHGVHSKSIRMSLRSTENPSEEKVVVDQASVFNQFYLALQWPGTVCKFQNCTANKPKKFTIRGLLPHNTRPWPNDNCCAFSTSTQEKCKFDYFRTITPALRKELELSWPGLFTSNQAAWEQGWKTQGACSVDVVTQPNYFQRANNLYKTLGSDLLQILETAGIKADGSIYPLKDIKNAIMRGKGVNVILNCHSDSSNTSNLEEITFCVNRDATQVQNCSTPTRDGCPYKLRFPSSIIYFPLCVV